MNTTKCRKYEVIKESTYVYPKYNIRIPMKVGDKYVVVGFTYHKNVLCYIIQDADDITAKKLPIPESHFKKYFGIHMEETT